MAITPCAPCSCIAGNIPNDKFKQDVEILLCAIAASVAPLNPENHEIVPFVAANVAFGSFTGAVFLDVITTEKVSFLEVNNLSNIDIEISFDGGATVYQYAPVGEVTRVYFEPVPLSSVDNVAIRGSGGTDPTAGSVLLSGYYDEITV